MSISPEFNSAPFQTWNLLFDTGTRHGKHNWRIWYDTYIMIIIIVSILGFLNHRFRKGTVSEYPSYTPSSFINAFSVRIQSDDFLYDKHEETIIKVHLYD